MSQMRVLFNALSDEIRLKILYLLSGGESCVCEMTEVLNLTQSKVSFHLGILKEAGLIADRKEGKWIYYHLNDADLFVRYLVLSCLERLKNEPEYQNIKRKA